METRINLMIQEQPDDETCGPTCLESVYRFYGREVALLNLIDEVDMLEEGGTVAANLARHALNLGYATELYSWNLHVFDPTWFDLSAPELVSKLHQQASAKPHRHKLNKATQAYVSYLEAGGDLRFQDITPTLIRGLIDQQLPIIAGLSSTFLYRSMRENPKTTDFDDVAGEPTGHFVVVIGYDLKRDTVLLADPYLGNTIVDGHYYETDVNHFINAVYLGVVTYDTNLLVIKPKET